VITDGHRVIIFGFSPQNLKTQGQDEAVAVTRAAALCLENLARRSSGPVRIRTLAWLIVRVRSPVALRLATISARIAEQPADRVQRSRDVHIGVSVPPPPVIARISARVSTMVTAIPF
jgi:hypothetical protein